MPKVRVTDIRRRVYELFKEGLIQAEVARRLHRSEEAIRKHKVKLLRAGHLQEIGDSGVFEPGPDAKWFEKAVRVDKRVDEPEVDEADGERSSQPSYRQAVPQVAAGSPLHRPSFRVSEYDLEGMEAHMHGSLKYDIERLGEMTEALVIKRGSEPLRVPLFTGPDNLNHNNNHRWDCDLQIPGMDWKVHLQLRTTPNVRQLYIMPPRLLITEEEHEESENRPGSLFRNMVIQVLNFLEKYAGWWFARTKGQRLGKVCGEVYYAYNNERLGEHIPGNIRGFADAPGIVIDQSKGSPEIETNREKVDNLWHLVHAKEHYEEMKGSIDDLMARQEAQERANQFYELKIAQVRGENLRMVAQMEGDNNQLLKAILSRQRINALDAEIDHKAIKTDEGAKDSSGVMYG